MGLALKIKTARSATILSMSNPNLMEINCKDERQNWIQLCQMVVFGTSGTDLGCLLAQDQ